MRFHPRRHLLEHYQALIKQVVGFQSYSLHRYLNLCDFAQVLNLRPEMGSMSLSQSMQFCWRDGPAVEFSNLLNLNQNHNQYHKYITYHLNFELHLITTGCCFDLEFNYSIFNSKFLMIFLNYQEVNVQNSSCSVFFVLNFKPDC